MAELGDFLSQDDDSTKDVTVDMLDYQFVNDCNDVQKLKGILNVLRSGKEGYYPDVSGSGQYSRIAESFYELNGSAR